MNTVKKVIKNVYFWVFLWAVLVTYYAVSLNSGYGRKSVDYFAYITQATTDICIEIFGFLAYKRAKQSISRKFFLFIFLSMLIGLGSTETYNILFNILKSTASTLNGLWVAPYTVFLIIQIFSWSYLLHESEDKKTPQNIAWFLRFFFGMSAIIVFSIVLFVGIFKTEKFWSVNTIQMINTIFEIVLFIILSISLSKAKNKSISYLATGFLFLLAFNLVHRVSYLSGYYYRTLDVAWLICYVFLIFGFIYFLEQKDDRVYFLENNSLHVLTSTVFASFSIFIVSTFVASEFFITSLEVNKIGWDDAFLKNVPSILIFSFTLSVLASKVVATKLSKPLEDVSKRIDRVQEKNINLETIPKGNFLIAEINKFDQFVLETIKKLQVSNQVKSDFLTHMSHDLRTPASGVHAMTKLVYDKITDDKLKRLQKFAVDSSKQLLGLLDEILDYSKWDNNLLKFQMTTINLHQLIQDVVLFMNAKAEEKGLKLNRCLQRESLSLSGDKAILYRVLTNIIGNAIKFTFQGGITISAFERKHSNGEKAIFITIEDTGIGIDEQYHTKIFAPFFRIDTEESAEPSGMGLGLSNTKLMLEKLNGEITVISSPGKGSTFTIILPNPLMTING